MNLTPDDLRIIAQAGPAWIRMLRAREERILSRIYGEFRNGKFEHVAALAEFACVREQINEITNAIKSLERSPA